MSAEKAVYIQVINEGRVIVKPMFCNNLGFIDLTDCLFFEIYYFCAYSHFMKVVV